MREKPVQVQPGKLSKMFPNKDKMDWGCTSLVEYLPGVLKVCNLLDGWMDQSAEQKPLRQNNFMSIFLIFVLAFSLW